MRLPLLLVIILLFFWLFPPGAGRAEETSQEYQLKLAFIVNFARFISWPEKSVADTTLSLCVFDNHPFGGVLDGVVGKKVGEYRLGTTVIDQLGQARACHLLFVPEAAVAEYLRDSDQLSAFPLVTIGEVEGFVDHGGGIEFVVRDGKLAFIINNSNLRERGIQVGSSLLNLAVAVR